jgi:hypothetical protein
VPLLHGLAAGSWLLGSARLLLAFPGFFFCFLFSSIWVFLALPGSSWLSLALPGSSCVVPPRFSWRFLALPGSSRVLLALPRSFPGSSWLFLALGPLKETLGASFAALDQPAWQGGRLDWRPPASGMAGRRPSQWLGGVWQPKEEPGGGGGGRGGGARKSQEEPGRARRRHEEG